MRQLHSLAFALAVAFATASPGLAAGKGQPELPPTETSGEIVFPGVCGFDVIFTLDGKGATITVPRDRLIVIAPGLKVTATNAANPANSVVLNSTGVFHQFTENGNAVTVVTGRNILFDPFAGLVLAIGTFRFAFDANGNLVEPLNGTGQLVDICALIQ